MLVLLQVRKLQFCKPSVLKSVHKNCRTPTISVKINPSDKWQFYFVRFPHAKGGGTAEKKREMMNEMRQTRVRRNASRRPTPLLPAPLYFYGMVISRANIRGEGWRWGGETPLKIRRICCCYANKEGGNSPKWMRMSLLTKEETFGLQLYVLLEYFCW